MINKKIPILFIVFSLLNSCSFDSKTGIWGDSVKEKKKITELEKKQKEIIKVEKIYSSDNFFHQEILLNNNIILSKAKNNLSWIMPNLNYQNFLGNIYLSGIDNFFLKKKIGKNKFSIYPTITPVLVFKSNIIFSDDNGTIFNINEQGRVIWKQNIYKKAYKKIYKALVFSIYGDNIYIADNIGFVYSINLNDGSLLWIKNYEVPFKSNIKVFDNMIFLINQDNKIFCLNTIDGSLIWNILSISSFIKSQNLLSLAITEEGDLIAITSSADVLKIRARTGDIIWSRNTADSLYADATDFFISSEIVISDNEVIFSSSSNTFSFDLNSGQTNWKQEVRSISTPIIIRENIFIVTVHGYFVILNKNTGEIISSSNILKILKKKKQKTKVTGFIMGSDKIYSTTLNGFLIVSSATTGKTEHFKKIGAPNISPLVINNGKLYILTDESKILVLN
jgi:outer membrane protein assembly factor BamB